MFIVFEGIDGSGKTTISKIVSEKLKWKYYKTPPIPFNNIRDIIDKNCYTTARFFFYLSSVCYASKEIEKILLTDSVVCDRYIYSTLAYHYTLDSDLKSYDLKNLNILIPNIIFYLKADYETRKMRIEKREKGINSSLSYDICMDKIFQEKVENEYLNNTSFEVIDVNALTIVEVSDICIKIIQKRLKYGI